MVAISADPAVTVPSTVTVPAGSNSAQFTFNVKDSAKGKASISATANGSSAVDDIEVP
jgi:hypothetical protein